MVGLEWGSSSYRVPEVKAKFIIIIIIIIIIGFVFNLI
jgi:hypothetical protein